MIRKTLKNTSKNEKLRALIEKYKIPPEYLSTNRKMVSRAVLLGLFIAFIPMPFQMLLVLAFVPFFKFNVPIGLAMCWLSNPLTMPPMYYMEYLTGSFLLGIKPEPVEMTLEWFSSNMDNIFIPLYAGTALYSVFGSLLAYWAVNHFWRSSVHRDKKIHRKHR
ncbi:MAG TPA: flagellar biosynthesis protein FlhF [Sulfurimonas sp. UBA12504]|nr:MAG: flagellar biosynthesis protein FlhF [Sulfurimonas sp. GWF2_37_8]DAB29806.1 MAG TPA: flagellar biosynthesis protein FlhF [Sulfurimonas sp. UBA12504]